jgi:hypothetical protein
MMPNNFNYRPATIPGSLSFGQPSIGGPDCVAKCGHHTCSTAGALGTPWFELCLGADGDQVARHSDSSSRARHLCLAQWRICLGAQTLYEPLRKRGFGCLAGMTARLGNLPTSASQALSCWREAEIFIVRLPVLRSRRRSTDSLGGGFVPLVEHRAGTSVAP